MPNPNVTIALQSVQEAMKIIDTIKRALKTSRDQNSLKLGTNECEQASKALIKAEMQLKSAG